nr:putative ribonuclease H-like domain-containing protein [Tanacetum cinerariifolium]
NTNDDVSFEVKEPEFEGKKPESEVHVSPTNSAKTKKHDDKTTKEAKGKSSVKLSTGYRNLSAEFEDFFDNNINEVNAASTPVPVVRQISTNSTNTFSVVGPSNTAVSPTHGKSLVLNMYNLTDIKDHLVTQIIGDLSSATQTRIMKGVVKDQGGLTQINNEDFHTCMFACFLSQEEPKRVHQSLKDLSWIEAIQEELLQFKMQKVWVLVDLPNGKRAIGTKWVFRNKKDERGIVVRNKARLVTQGHTQEEGIDYEEVFTPVARLEAIRLFLAYASFIGFMVYQMDVKSAFLYETIEEEVYVCQPPGFEDPDYPDKVNDVTRLQALIDSKKVIITEAIVQEALCLDDAESIDCLPNEDIFTKLSRMGLVRNVDSSLKFYMYPQFLQLMIRAQVGDLSSDTIKYSSPALTQKVFANMRRVGKGFFGVETPLFEGMIVAQQADDVDDEGVAGVDVDAVIPTLPPSPIAQSSSPPLQQQPSQPTHDAEISMDLLQNLLETSATTPITTAIITAAPSAAKRRKGVDDVIEQVQRKEKEDNAVLRYQALKRKPQTEAQARKNMMIYLRNMAGFKMDYFKGMSYDDIRLIFKKYFNFNVALLKKTKEQIEEEDNRALKRKTESSEEKEVKKQKLDEEVEELKKHLQIVPHDDDDVYTDATPLALKVPVVDYEIHTENNKSYYKIIRADETYQLFLSFLILLRNFDREDLEVLWQIVKERFASSKPKNFSDDFLLTTLTYMFEKPNVKAQV